MLTRTGDTAPFVIAVLVAQVIGSLVTQMSPLVVGGVITGLELTEQQAGLVVFAEFTILSITAIFIAPFLPRLDCRSLCMVAAAAAITAQGVSLLVSNLSLLVIFRCIAGAGEGMVYAVSLAVVASRSANPDKLYGYIQIMWAVLNAVLFALGGLLTNEFAHKGIYGMILVISVMTVIFLRGLPSDKSGAQKAVVDSGDPSLLMGLITMAGIFLYLTASAAIYTFTAPLGERAGLSTSQIGYALTAGSVVGFTGAGMATWLNIRLGRVIPITVFATAFSVIAVVISINTNPAIYVTALMLSIVFFYFSVPYLFGLAAALDRQGRWAAAAGSAYLLGFAVGPAYAGSLIEWFEYRGLGIASAITTLCAWVMFMVVARSLPETE